VLVLPKRLLSARRRGWPARRPCSCFLWCRFSRPPRSPPLCQYHRAGRRSRQWPPPRRVARQHPEVVKSNWFKSQPRLQWSLLPNLVGKPEPLLTLMLSERASQSRGSASWAPSIRPSSRRPPRRDRARQRLPSAARREPCNLALPGIVTQVSTGCPFRGASFVSMRVLTFDRGMRGGRIVHPVARSNAQQTFLAPLQCCCPCPAVGVSRRRGKNMPCWVAAARHGHHSAGAHLATHARSVLKYASFASQSQPLGKLARPDDACSHSPLGAAFSGARRRRPHRVIPRYFRQFAPDGARGRTGLAGHAPVRCHHADDFVLDFPVPPHPLTTEVP